MDRHGPADTPASSQDQVRRQFYRGNVSIGAGVTNFYSTGNLVDAVSNTWVEQGETRQNFPMDGIQEFKLQRKHNTVPGCVGNSESTYAP
jgi:hypothetical protein